MANECLREVNERSTFVVIASFLDEDNNPVTPSAATYRLDNLGPNGQRGTGVLASTNITPLSTSVEIRVDDDQNAIINSHHAFEIIALTVEYDYNAGADHGTAEYRYKVINLYGVDAAPILDEDGLPILDE